MLLDYFSTNAKTDASRTCEVEKIKELHESKLGTKYKVDLENALIRYIPDQSRITKWLASNESRKVSIRTLSPMGIRDRLVASQDS